jgi:hypothetical protein
VTNPNPLDFPVILSSITTDVSIAPYYLKKSRKLVYVISWGSPPTNNLFDIGSAIKIFEIVAISFSTSKSEY